MKKFFKWLWEKIKIATKLMITRTFLFLGFVFTWVIPIYILSQNLAFTQEYTTGWKFTFIGLIIVGFVTIKFWGKIKAKLNALQPKKIRTLIMQILLMIIYNGGTFAIWFFLLKYFALFIVAFNQWYAISLIFFGFGILWYSIDSIIMFFKAKKEKELEIETMKEEIKNELGE